MARCSRASGERNSWLMSASSRSREATSSSSRDAIWLKSVARSAISSCRRSQASPSRTFKSPAASRPNATRILRIGTVMKRVSKALKMKTPTRPL